MAVRSLSQRPLDKDDFLSRLNREIIPFIRAIRVSLGNLGGDVTGTSDATVVQRLRGAVLGTAAGSLTTGAVLRVTGPSAVDYGQVDLANVAAVVGILAAANVDRSVSGYTIVSPALLTFSLGAGTVDVNPYNVPATPAGPNRFSLTMLKVRLESAITGGGTVVIRAGTTVGGNDLLVDSAAWNSATAVGTEVGVSLADIGIGVPASTGYITELAASAAIWVRATTGGGGVTAGAAKVYPYGGLAA